MVLAYPLVARPGTPVPGNPRWEIEMLAAIIFALVLVGGSVIWNWIMGNREDRKDWFR